MTKVVLNQFEKQRTRGTTSFGFYLPTQDRLVHNIKESRIKSLLKRTRGQNTEVLFHHRFSTSTPDVRNACHPFSTKTAFTNEYIGIHNGVVSNAWSLQREHKDLGIDYVSVQPPEGQFSPKFNDSEALIYDIVRYIEGQTKGISAYGSIAFIIMKLSKTKKPLKLYFGTNRGDLYMKRTKNNMVISSEGSGALIPNGKLHTFDYKTGKVTAADMEIPRTFPYTAPVRTNPSTNGDAASGYHYSANPAYNHSHESSRRLDGGKDIRGGDDRRDIPGWGGAQELNLDGDNDEPDWEDLSREEQEAVIAQTLSDYDDSDLPQYMEGRDKEFIVRMGKPEDVKRNIFQECKNDYNRAIAFTRKLITDTSKERERLDNIKMNKLSNAETHEVISYYELVSDYAELLDEVNTRLTKEAQAEADKEDEGARAFGFQTSRDKSSRKGFGGKKVKLAKGGA